MPHTYWVTQGGNARKRRSGRLVTTGTTAALLAALLTAPLCADSYELDNSATIDPAGAPAASLYERVVSSLEAGPPAQRQDFALLALKELSSAYREEAALVRASGDQADGRHRLWLRDVETYRHQLLRLARRIERGASVDIFKQPLTAATLAVGDRQVMLTHPRPDHQRSFEQQLLTDYCRSHTCDPLAGDSATTSAITPGPLETGRIVPTWEFTMAGPACSHRGMRLLFDAGTDFDAVRDTCKQLFNDLGHILKALAWHRAHQVAIHWHSLHLKPGPDENGQILEVNSVGDLTTLQAPLLAKAPGLLAETIPWLQARLAGRDYAVSLRAVPMPGNSPPFHFRRVPYAG